MHIMILFTLWLISAQAFAGVDCPWKSAEALFQLDSDRQDPDRWLSVHEVAEDIACTRLILENFYVAQESVQTSPVLKRLIQYAPPQQGMKAKELQQVLFSFHQDIFDAHLGYQLGSLQARHVSRSPRSVTINNFLKEEMIYQGEHSIYFKVGSLKGDLTPVQSEFIEMVKNQNLPFILDLRGNGGGDNEFAEALALALHTSTEKIPQHRFEHVDSLFKNVGLLNHLRLLEYRGIEEYENQIVTRVRGATVADILPFSWNIESSSLLGERSSPFTSNMTLIIDGSCASACETIVEKLSWHPRVKTIGHSTRGALHFGDAMLFELPHSAIWAKIPSAREIMENDAREGVGYSPDVERDHIILEELGFAL